MDTSTGGAAPEPVTVHRYLVTAAEAAKWETWQRTAPYANWIEGRDNGDRETWLVTCRAEHGAALLDAAKATGVTVEEIDGAGDTETYRLLAGEPGSGWKP